jgi:hypothetical protein
MGDIDGDHVTRRSGMRHLSRVGAGLVALVALLTLVSGTALAGNYGEVTIIDGAAGPPTAGEEREIRFSLLQHGVAPIEDGRVDVTLTHPGTGDDLTVQAVHLGDGIWVARVTFPAAGEWRIGVTHQWFETSPPTTLAVSPVEGLSWLPTALAIGAFAAAALVVTGGMLLIRDRSVPPRRPIRAEG